MKTQIKIKESLQVLCAAILSILFLPGCLFTGQTGKEKGEARQDNRLVARKDYDVGANWQPRQIMGRDFWHMLKVNTYTQPDKGSYASTHMRELVDKPIFKEIGLNHAGDGDKPFVLPGSNRMSLAAIDPKGYLELVDARPGAPFFIIPGCVRPDIYKLMKKWEYDTAGYNAWKKAHPNFMGCINGETDNDFLGTVPWRNSAGFEKFKKTCQDAGLIATIEKAFPKPQNREELTAQYMNGIKAFREFFFNDADKVSYMRAAHCQDHYFYESGQGVGILETTDTGSGNGSFNYRHQVSLFFSRGAARQYGKNWCWYIAADLNGYDDKGKFGYSSPDYRVHKAKSAEGASGNQGPGYGMSASLVARDTFLAYLSGASFVEHECWLGYLHTNENKRWDLSSPLGRVWEDWFEFTRKNPDRGASYAPVALLVPFEQGYPNYGGKSWAMFKYERPDWMIDAFMFTIMPHSPVTTNGNEGALANSPYGDIYDVIVPNPPSGPVSIDVLNTYKVAAMLGNYSINKALAKRLMEYVKGGGTLLLNIKQVNEFFPAKFLGFEKAAVAGDTNAVPAVEVKGPIRSLSDGKDFVLTEGYEMEAVKLKGAAPLLEDAGGNVLACKNSYGKGNVIVSTVDCLVPKNNMEYQGWDVLGNMVYGKQFPFVEYFLGNIVKEVLPLEVKGDIEYGMNKLADGWLLYLINNKGVTKFTNKEQTLDMSKTAKVEVCLKDIKAATITELREQKTIQKDDKNNSFTVDVPPGDIRIFKIKN